MPNNSHSMMFGIRSADLNIWRIAGFIAGTCTGLLVLLVAGFVAYSCNIGGNSCNGVAFHFRDVFVVIGGLGFFAVFVFVTFAYFWFRLFRRRISKFSIKNTTDAAEREIQYQKDWQGMLFSSALVLVILALAHFFHIN